MTVILVRHARAGERVEWQGDDRLRPLDERGHRQALGLVDALGLYAIERILSSPYLRCVQTVEPLAAARGVAIEPREELGEERQHAEGLALVRSLGGSAVVCTHGGAPWGAFVERYRKGSAIVLGDDGRVELYLPPPA